MFKTQIVRTIPKAKFQECFRLSGVDIPYQTLEGYGFGSKWCQYIADCITTETFLVLVNDQLGKHIRCHRAIGIEIYFYPFYS